MPLFILISRPGIIRINHIWKWGIEILRSNRLRTIGLADLCRWRDTRFFSLLLYRPLVTDSWVIKGVFTRSIYVSSAFQIDGRIVVYVYDKYLPVCSQIVHVRIVYEGFECRCQGALYMRQTTRVHIKLKFRCHRF